MYYTKKKKKTTLKIKGKKILDNITYFTTSTNALQSGFT